MAEGKDLGGVAAHNEARDLLDDPECVGLERLAGLEGAHVDDGVLGAKEGVGFCLRELRGTAAVGLRVAALTWLLYVPELCSENTLAHSGAECASRLARRTRCHAKRDCGTTFT